MKAVALLAAYLMIGAGAALIAHGATQTPTSPAPIRIVQHQPSPSPWIQRYAALVALAAFNAYEAERK
jgi:hypothetical protein